MMSQQSIPLLLIDAGTGNLHSVFQTLRTITDQIVISDKPEDVLKAGRIILPGVGAFSGFMQGLQQRNLVDPIHDFIKKGNPLLGICVGMQAFFDYSEENGNHKGLGHLPGFVQEFQNMPNLKVPHTGWNQLWFRVKALLLQNISPGDYVYFNHSYYCVPENPGDIAATTDYGIDFCSIVQRENVYGVQFHPEKSQKVGIQVLSNFVNLGRKS
ncbi:MAG: imidazole glycerol phosphate synthase subunit HisH [Chloroflexi bacterium HGW-Chloroflexi-3]|nr:MAG: imidazole glycerol phosphate synthase subunit HisH [Chloroflexi bacterium HGW-Chloroflexi-3]